MNQTIPRVGLAAILYKGDKVLMGRRKADNLVYALPGGHVELYEQFSECAAREVLEETGLIVPAEKWRLFKIFNVIRKEKNYHYVTVYMAAKAPDQEPQNLEPHKHDDWEWIDSETLDRFKTEGNLFYSVQDALDDCGGAHKLIQTIMQ